MRHIEDTLQKTCVQWFSLAFRPYHRLLHHSPNGGKRNAIEAAKFKAMGVRAGFPDLGLFIELKTAKGRQTDNQKYFQKALEAQGYRYEVVRSLNDFRQIISNYMNEKQDDYDR
jgi:hypothetical protein